MGNPDPQLRFPIVSFNVVAPWPLHPRFVTRLLSDLFGVQTRAGCSCAGPHGVDLLGLSPEQELDLANWLVDEEAESALSSIKPGWCRLNLHYTMDDDELWYLKEVLSFVVEHGAHFLSVYSFDAFSGSWEFRPPDAFRAALVASSDESRPHRLSLQTALEGVATRHPVTQQTSNRRQMLVAQLSSASQLLQRLPKKPALVPPPAPLSLMKFPKQGPQPFFVVAEGQVHNLAKLERSVSLHATHIRLMPVDNDAEARKHRQNRWSCARRKKQPEA